MSLGNEVDTHTHTHHCLYVYERVYTVTHIQTIAWRYMYIYARRQGTMIGVALYACMALVFCMLVHSLLCLSNSVVPVLFNGFAVCTVTL